VPLQQIAARAEAAWRAQHGEADADAGPLGRDRDEDPSG
jgi:hypothetical protein